jgi:lipid A disaccharide synthetase
MYHANKVLWHLLGRWIVQTKFLSLVNILAGKELVPEFMPYFKSPRQVYETAVKLVNDPGKLKQTSSDLIDLTLPLAQKNAPETAAKMISEMLKKKPVSLKDQQALS